MTCLIETFSSNLVPLEINCVEGSIRLNVKIDFQPHCIKHWKYFQHSGSVLVDWSIIIAIQANTAMHRDTI